MLGLTERGRRARGCLAGATPRHGKRGGSPAVGCLWGRDPNGSGDLRPTPALGRALLQAAYYRSACQRFSNPAEGTTGWAPDTKLAAADGRGVAVATAVVCGAGSTGSASRLGPSR